MSVPIYPTETLRHGNDAVEFDFILLTDKIRAWLMGVITVGSRLNRKPSVNRNIKSERFKEKLQN